MKFAKHVSATVAALSLGLSLGMASFQAQASGNMTGTLNAQMVLQAGCTISGAASAGTSGVNFGTLNFGTQPSAFTGVLTATPTGGAAGAGATQITCSPDVTAITVSVSGGSNAGQGTTVGTGSRALKYGASYLPYEVYSDSGMTTAYPVNATAVGVTLPGTGAATALPVYGKVNKTSANALPAGNYVDTLQVTLSW